MAKRILLLVLGALVITFLMTTVALAAHSPQDIYNDFDDNGKLDHHYTDAELRAYLNDNSLHMYKPKDRIDRLDDLVNDLLTRETFPFTGFQLLMAGIVAVVLVGGGVALRRLSRPHNPQKS